MAKTSTDDWDTDPDQNTDINDISIVGSVQVVSQLDNIIREMMAQLATKLATVISATSAVFSDAIFGLTATGDTTKKLVFSLVNITTGTTRTVTVPDANVTMAAINLEAQTLTGGANVTVKDLGNLSGASLTPTPGNRPKQKVTNNGAGSILPGSTAGDYILEVINTTGAGAITTTGWTLKGDSFDTTTTSKFLCSCHVSSDQKLMVITKTA